MPAFGPVKRRNLIRYLVELGFEGPYSGGNHQYMVREQIRVRSRTRTGAMSVEDSYKEFSSKLRYRKRSGRGSEGATLRK